MIVHRVCKRYIFFFCFGLAVCIIASTHCYAQRSTARFLYWRPTAVSNALGGIGTAYFEDASAAYFNPAALAFGPNVSVASSLVKPFPFFGSEVYSFISASAKIEDFGTIALSTNLYWKGAHVRTGPELSKEDLFDWQAKLSFGFPIAEHISAGAGLSFLRMMLSEFGAGQEQGSGKSSAFLGDLGVFASSLFTEATWSPQELDDETEFSKLADTKIKRGLSAGLAILNIGPKISFIDNAQADPPPTVLSAGVTYFPLQSNMLGLMLALDLEKRLYDGAALDYIHYGAEVTFLRILAIRAGYFKGMDPTRNSFPTIGAGIRLKYCSLNIARYTQTILPTWHYDASFFMEL